jgi:hypothetical protein
MKDDQIKEDKMDGACIKSGDEKCVQNFGRKP